ncbi:hypothetical protein GCK32_001813 [Trichostrongylus colubriformis]|uniref:Uncharacterized protein n=1 Tax=Trichostrongylus colubriformis TaxID=6319 RepID=A0AAN8EW75_TRICO
MIATHGGVGFRCERLLSLACADALRDGKDDVVSVVSILEDNPLFNCGYGSNPTMSGTVECEAGFMSSDGLRRLSRIDRSASNAGTKKDVVEACTSSGGLMLKSPGRLGHCAMFGGGTWAERRGSTSIGVTVSGCGEAIMRANFSRSLADRLLERDPDELSSSIVHSFFEHEFLHSNLTSPITANRLYAGGLVLIQEGGELSELIVFHNTPVLPFAYCTGKVVRRSLSKLPAGSNILVESYPCR